MIPVSYLRHLLNALMAIMWTPAAAWAATAAYDEQLAAVSLTALGLAFSLSTLSGSAALVWRLNKELANMKDGSLPRLWLFVASNILGSWTAGALAWVGALSRGLDVWSMFLAVILLSFGGARVVEKLAEIYTKKGDER